MRRARRLAAGLALALALGAPAAAGAQSTSSSLFAIGGGSPQLERSGSVRITGQLTVNFHGDVAGGCAQRRLCGYSGWVSWRPPSSGALMIFESRRHGHLISSPTLELEGSGFPPVTGVTNASVQFEPGPASVSSVSASCVDAVPSGSSIPLSVRRGQVVFSLGNAGPALLADRCAGPRDADVIPQLPAPALSLTAVDRGGSVVSLTASRGFAAHGFAGTIQSTIVLHLGRFGNATQLTNAQPRKGKRYRELVASYRAQLSGSVVEHVTGDPHPGICGPLGSCGVSGTLTLRPHVQAGEADMYFYARGSVAPARLLATVGLGHARPPSVSGTGFFNWGQGGVAETALGPPGAVCLDSEPLQDGGILLAAGRGRLVAEYLPPGFLPGGVPATGCAGPDPSTGMLASAELPVTALTRRTLHLSLSTGSRLVDYGYRIRTTAHLTLTLTRRGTRLTVITLPSGLTL